MVLPVVALRGLTVLPKMRLHFDVSREKSVAAVEQAMMQDQRILLVTQLHMETEDPGMADLYALGTICQIKQILKLPNNVVRVLAEGENRARILNLDSDEGFLSAVTETAPVEQTPYTDVEREAMISTLRGQIEAYAKLETNFGETAVKQLAMISGFEDLLMGLMVRFPVQGNERQEMLELPSTHAQFCYMMEKMGREMEMNRIKGQIQEKVKVRVDKNQRDYLLREQMKVIHEELGEDDTENDADLFAQQVDAMEAPDEIKEKLRKEIRRFKAMPMGSQEAAVIRTYIETALEMPWSKVSEESADIHRASEILETEHYGLEKIKERILEYLAVRMFTGEAGGTILCLVGPPGTGKTSIARSVAHALNKKYVRVCLGGVHDEAEIRGHRRTYVGSMPGRIANGMKQAGVSNPLMLLDEVDKVSSDHRGDTSSALLEVLDSEQNNKFLDHYLEVPMDLSRVMFIATANSTSTIPRPLLDRMEIIEVSSYTENEKFHIAEDYLVKKQMTKHGLKADQLVLTDAAIKRIIHNYTREAGVRSLERKIGDICRKVAREILEEGTLAVCVDSFDLEQYLGKEKISFQKANEKGEPGIVRGLAWTAVGGDTLEIEVNVLPGTGKLVLTGQMGDVMKESAQTGLTYVRSVAERYDVEAEYFEKHDIHIHIPEGAVPKDGPSAGITMATAMLSAVTDTPVRPDLAMTGEVTLRGRVLPIGGLKEKLLAAKQAEIRMVLVPEKNRPDVEELSEEITGGLTIVFVSRMEDVLANALEVRDDH